MSKDDNDGPRDKPTGYKSPPVATRWQKGGPSPNPSGAPTKAIRERKKRQKFESFAGFVSRESRRTAITSNGEEISMLERDMRRLRQLAYDKQNPNLKALIYAIELERDALRDEEDTWLKYVEHWSHYKQVTSEHIARNERYGYKLPNYIPHPDDIIITQEGVRFLGPTTPEGEFAMRLHQANRDEITRQLDDVMAAPMSKADLQSTFKYLRGRWNRLNYKLPPRLRQRWPNWSDRPLKYEVVEFDFHKINDESAGESA